MILIATASIIIAVPMMVMAVDAFLRRVAQKKIGLQLYHICDATR